MDGSEDSRKDADGAVGSMGCGLIHLYYGDGKGKTTAAVGLAVRAVACRLRVCFVQFMKPGDSAELDLLERVGVKTMGIPQSKFSFQMDSDEIEQARTRNDALLDRVIQEPCDMLVLDEVVNACRTGLVSPDALDRLLDRRPAAMELVLTGRGPSQKLVDCADYATEMVCRKHPFEQGIAARRGIEY